MCKTPPSIIQASPIEAPRGRRWQIRSSLFSQSPRSISHKTHRTSTPQPTTEIPQTSHNKQIFHAGALHGDKGARRRDVH